MKALQINPSGSKEIVDIAGYTIAEQNDAIFHILGGHYDCVTLKHQAVMLVNDMGIFLGLPVNLDAMRITRYPYVAGIAMILGVEDTPDGGIFVDCPSHYADSADTKGVNQ